METEIIKEKLIYLKQLLSKLEIRLNKYELETNEEEKETLFAASTKFSEEIVETAIKINNLILEHNDDFASSYFDTFTKINKHYNINKELIQKIAKTAAFKNRITHEYNNIDEEITFRSFKNLLTLYKKYIQIIKNII